MAQAAYSSAHLPEVSICSLLLLLGWCVVGCGSNFKQSLEAAPALSGPTAVLASSASLSLHAGQIKRPAASPAGTMQNVVFLGDSLTAGFQNGSLLGTAQVHGYAALIAQQAGVGITLPLVSSPGFPAVLSYDPNVFPPVLQSSGQGTRANPSQQPTNLAVPGQLLNDLLSAVPVAAPDDSNQLMTNLVLANPDASPNTQLQQALSENPTAIFLWIGNNDALVADLAGSQAAMTPVASFSSDFYTLVYTLATQTKATLFIANIPDVTLVPYLTSAGAVLNSLSAQTGIPAVSLSYVFGIQSSDLVTPTGYTTMEASAPGLLLGQVPPPLPDADVLSVAEQAQVRATIASYNQVIAQDAAAAGATLIDMHAFIGSLAQGVEIDGREATVGYLGGLFSLDGIHLTNTGYALIANQFLLAVNQRLGVSIPMVDIKSVAAQDPLFNLSYTFVGGEAQPASAVNFIPIRAGRQMEWMLKRH